MEGTRRLIEAAGRARVGHLLTVSIVGIERAPGRYYRTKLAQEQLVRSGAVPWTIVRSTQFHELLGGALAAAARWRLSPRASARVQPVAAVEAARAVAAVAAVAGGASGERRVVQVGGPEVRTLSELARAWAAHDGRRLVPLALPLPGRAGDALRQGVLTCPQPDTTGTIPFSSWLDRRY